MPAASCRTSPARTMSRWLIASASAGSSRSVGMSERVQRIDAARCPASSEEAEEPDPLEVVVHRVDHQEHQQHEADLLRDLSLPERQGPSQDGLADEEQEMATVEHRNRQEIQQEQVHADDRGEERQAG